MNANNILYETALKQFDTVAEMLNIEDGIRERMRNPGYWHLLIKRVLICVPLL